MHRACGLEVFTLHITAALTDKIRRIKASCSKLLILFAKLKDTEPSTTMISMLVSLTLALVATSGTTSASFGSREERSLAARHQDFPGINFNYLNVECTPEQQDILLHLAQSTEDFLTPATRASEGSIAWRKFFGYVDPHINYDGSWKGAKNSRVPPAIRSKAGALIGSTIVDTGLPRREF